MNNVEAGRACIEEGSEERYIFHASLISSQWHDATQSSNLIYCYHLQVGVEYSNQKSTKKHHEVEISNTWWMRPVPDPISWEEAVTAWDMQLKRKKLFVGEFMRFGLPLLSQFCADNEGEQKTLGMGFTVFLACYLLCVSAYTLCLSGKKLT